MRPPIAVLMDVACTLFNPCYECREIEDVEYEDISETTDNNQEQGEIELLITEED